MIVIQNDRRANVFHVYWNAIRIELQNTAHIERSSSIEFSGQPLQVGLAIEKKTSSMGLFTYQIGCGLTSVK